MTWMDFYFRCREANAILAPVVLAALAYRAIPLLFMAADMQWKVAVGFFHGYVLVSGLVSAQLLVNGDVPGPTAPLGTALHLGLLALMMVWRQTEMPEAWKRKPKQA